MPYMGIQELKDANVKSGSATGDGSTTTFAIGWTPPSAGSLFVTINGVLQSASAYSISASNCVFTAAPVSADAIEFKGIQSSGTVVTLGDGVVNAAQLGSSSVVTASIVDNNVTLAKMADGTQGDTLYYGASGAPTLLAKPGTPADEVLTFATGATAPTWVAPAAGGKVLQVLMGASNTPVEQTAVVYIDSGLTVTITPSAATSKILILANHGTIRAEGGTSIHLKLLRDTTDINQWGAGWLQYVNATYAGGSGTFTYLDSPNSTSALVYKTQFKTESAGSGLAVAVMSDSTDGSIIALEIGA